MYIRIGEMVEKNSITERSNLDHLNMGIMACVFTHIHLEVFPHYCGMWKWQKLCKDGIMGAMVQNVHSSSPSQSRPITVWTVIVVLMKLEKLPFSKDFFFVLTIMKTTFNHSIVIEWQYDSWVHQFIPDLECSRWQNDVDWKTKCHFLVLDFPKSKSYH